MPRLVLDPTNSVIGTVIGTLHRPSSSSLKPLPAESAVERARHLRSVGRAPSRATRDLGAPVGRRARAARWVPPARATTAPTPSAPTESSPPSSVRPFLEVGRPAPTWRAALFRSFRTRATSFRDGGYQSRKAVRISFYEAAPRCQSALSGSPVRLVFSSSVNLLFALSCGDRVAGA